MTLAEYSGNGAEKLVVLNFYKKCGILMFYLTRKSTIKQSAQVT